MYAIILFISIQAAQSLTPYFGGLEFAKGADDKVLTFDTLTQCRKLESSFNTYRPKDTDPNKQFAWQEAQCKKVR